MHKLTRVQLCKAFALPLQVICDVKEHLSLVRLFNKPYIHISPLSKEKEENIILFITFKVQVEEKKKNFSRQQIKDCNIFGRKE